MVWARQGITGSGPCARCNHTTVKVDSGKIIVYGGWNGNSMLKDLHILNLSSMTWWRPLTTGKSPGSRAGHSFCSFENKLLLFGGGDQGGRYLNDLYLFDSDVCEWNQCSTTGQIPSPRSLHTSILVNTCLWIFGGGDNVTVPNDLHVLNLETLEWSISNYEGNPPCNRWGHSCTLINQDEFLIFGGTNGTHMYNDLHVFNTKTLLWKKIEIKGDQIPIPRSGHTTTAVKNNTLLTFGGGDGTNGLNDIWLLDLQQWTWSQPQFSKSSPLTPRIHESPPPLGRCAHTATFVTGQDSLIIFGGSDGNSRLFKDVYILYTGQIIPNNNQEQNQQNISRFTNIRSQVNRAKQNTKLIQPKSSFEDEKVSKLLESLNLGHCTENFQKEKITVSVLEYLNEKHLDQLGIITLGSKLRLLKAIRNLGKEHDFVQENQKQLYPKKISL